MKIVLDVVTRGRIGIYARKPLDDVVKSALGLVYVGVHPSRDGWNYRYRRVP